MKRPRFLTALGAVIIAAVLAVPLSAQTTRPMATSHDIEDQEDCLMCHTEGMMDDVPAVPATHEGRTNLGCQWCHAADSPMLTTDPSAISHDIEDQEDCLMCHTEGMMDDVPPAPASHEGRGNEHCQMCHKAATG